MLCVSVLLVTVPIYQSPVQSVVAFVGVLSGVPVYFIFVMETPWRLRPKMLDRTSGKMCVSGVQGVCVCVCAHVHVL